MTAKWMRVIGQATTQSKRTVLIPDHCHSQKIILTSFPFVLHAPSFGVAKTLAASITFHHQFPLGMVVLIGGLVNL